MTVSAPSSLTAVASSGGRSCRVGSARGTRRTTFDHPHFTVVLPDLSELTLVRLDRAFDAPIPNPAGPPARYR